MHAQCLSSSYVVAIVVDEESFVGCDASLPEYLFKDTAVGLRQLLFVGKKYLFECLEHISRKQLVGTVLPVHVVSVAQKE